MGEWKNGRLEDYNHPSFGEISSPLVKCKAVSVNLKRSNYIIVYLAFAALLALALWLRWRFIHTVQLYPDEFVTLLAAQMIKEKGLPVMPSGLFYDHGLLFSYAGSLAAWLGQARWAARYVSLLFGLLTLGLTFWVGRRWFSPAVGLIAVTGLVIAPTAIEWSGRARMYALLQLLILVTLWLTYEGIAKNKPGLRWAALLAYLGATLTHFLAVTLAPPLVLAGGVVWRQTRQRETGEESPRRPAASLLPRLIEIAAFLFILVVAFLVKRAGQPKGIDPVSAATALPGLVQVLTIYTDFSLNLADVWRAFAPFYLTLPALIFTPFALLAAAIDLTTFFTSGFSWPLRFTWWNSPPVAPKEKNQSTPPSKGGIERRFPASLPSLFLSSILLTTTLEMIFLAPADRRDDKYLFMLLPLLFLLGAQGMITVGKIIINTPKAQFFSLFVSGLILTLTQPAVHTLLANTGDDYDAAFAYVQAHQQPGDVIFTGTPAAAAFYLGRNDFYGVQRRGGYDYRLLTIAGREVDRWLGSPVIRAEAELHQALAGRRVWLILERWGLQREYYDLPFQQQLLAQTELADEVQGIFILRSKANPQPLRLDPAQPREVNFGNLVRLTGYTIEPERPTPGNSLRLTLYWQALAPIPRDYTVFVHLRRASTTSAQTVAQADHRPLDDLYPMSLWPVGETIRESSDKLSLPSNLPPGNYELWTGLYWLETGERLPVQNDASGENAVKLGDLRFE